MRMVSPEAVSANLSLSANVPLRRVQSSEDILETYTEEDDDELACNRRASDSARGGGGATGESKSGDAPVTKIGSLMVVPEQKSKSSKIKFLGRIKGKKGSSSSSSADDSPVVLTKFNHHGTTGGNSDGLAYSSSFSALPLSEGSNKDPKSPTNKKRNRTPHFV